MMCAQCSAVPLVYSINYFRKNTYYMRLRPAHQSRETVCGHWSVECGVSCVCVWAVAVCLCVGCAARSLLTIHHLLLPPRHGGDGETWLALAHCAGVLATIDSACTPLRDEGARLLEARGCEAGTMV